MPYTINGQNIETIAETAPTSDRRTASTFSTSKYQINGQTYTARTGRKFITHQSGYRYSNEVGIQTRFQRAGSSAFSVSRRGYRPISTFRFSAQSTFYINKFSDGEVWASATDNTKVGVRIGTGAEDMNYLFFAMCGGGGGGGGSSGTRSAGGGGGAAYVFSLITLRPQWKHEFNIGSAGTGGGGNTNGNNGGTSSAVVYTSKTNTVGSFYLIAYGGRGGLSGGNSGLGGAGGHTSGTGNNEQYFYTVRHTSGGTGGERGNNGLSCAVNFNNYTPEAEQITYLTGLGGNAGDSTTNGGGGGGGSPLGNGGNGGGTREDGFPGTGHGAGGGGGIWVTFSSRNGGNGAPGTCTIYY